MPSKLNYELNKLRGITEADGKIYTASIAALQDTLIDAELAIKCLESKKEDHSSKINNINSIAKNALTKVNNAIPKNSGNTFFADRTRTIFLSNPYYGTYTTGIRGAYLDPDAVKNAYYNSKLPKDFKSLIAVQLIYSPAVFGVENTVILDINIRFGSIDQLYNIHNNSTTGASITIDDSNLDLYQLDLSLFNNITVNDYFSIKIERDADHVSDTFTENFCIKGILIFYKADM